MTSHMNLMSDPEPFVSVLEVFQLEVASLKLYACLSLELHNNYLFVQWSFNNGISTQWIQLISIHEVVS